MAVWDVDSVACSQRIVSALKEKLLDPIHSQVWRRSSSLALIDSFTADKFIVYYPDSQFHPGRGVESVKHWIQERRNISRIYA